MRISDWSSDVCSSDLKMGFGGAETETRRVVRTARAIHQLAPEAIVTVDLNQAWDMTTCMRLLPQMDDAGIAMVEQPLPFWNKDGMAALCSRLRMAVVEDEGLWDRSEERREGKECDGRGRYWGWAEH